MKVLISFALACFMLSGIYAQKCRYISNTVSGMDGTRLVITEPEIFTEKSDFGTVEVWAKLHQDTVIVLSFVLNGSDAISVQKGDSLLLIQEDMGKLNLEIMQDAERQKDIARSITIYALVSNDEYHAITDARIRSALIQTGEDWIKLESDTRSGAKAIQKVLACVHEFLTD